VAGVGRAFFLFAKLIIDLERNGREFGEGDAHNLSASLRLSLSCHPTN